MGNKEDIFRLRILFSFLQSFKVNFKGKQKNLSYLLNFETLKTNKKLS